MITEKNNVFYCDCGFSFLRGHSGAHDCAVGLRNKLAKSESRCAALAAENAIKQEFIKTCFLAAADGASLDGADIQELGERLGLFGRETYQPVLHGYICGNEAGEDSVYVMKPTPETDAFLAEVRASAIEHAASERWGSGYVFDELNEFAAQIRKGVQS